MRPAIARATLRAASSLVARNPPRAPSAAATAATTLSSSTRACSTSSVSNDPILKHTSVSASSSSSSTSADALRHSTAAATGTSPSLADEHLRSSASSSSSPSAASSSDNPDTNASSTTATTTATTIQSSTSTVSAASLNAQDETSSSDDPTLSSVSVETAGTTETQVVIDDASQIDSASESESDPASASTSTFVDNDRNSTKHLAPGETSSELLAQIRGYLRRNAIRSALFHFISALKVEGSPAVDKAVLKMVLPVLGRHGWAPTALEAVDLALEREYNLEIGLYNCALHAMARSGDYDTIQTVIRRMWSLPSESRPNATSFNYLIGSFMYRGAVDRAFEVLHEMKKHMIYPTFATYHALICGCLRSNDPRRAYTTLNAVERQRFDIGAMTVSQVLVSCADADLCDEVHNLLPRLEEALPRYAKEVHRIAEKRQAYRLSPKGGKKTEDDTTSSLERAELRGMPRVELGAISAVLHCAFRNCRPDLAVAGWSLLNKHYPDTKAPETFWYCLIGSYAGAGDFERAFEVLGAMREQGHEPRLRDLDMTLVRPLSMEINKVDEQYYRLCDKAKSGGGGADINNDIDIDNPSFEAVAEAETTAHGEETAVEDVAVAPGDADEEAGTSPVAQVDDDDTSSASASLGDILAEKPTMDSVTSHWKDLESEKVGIEELNCIIAACSYAGDLDRAFQTYDEVESVFGLEKNVETFNALLEGCIQVKHVRGGLRIISEMERNGMKLEGTSLQLAVRLLTRAARAPECVDMVKRVREQGGKVSLQTYLLLVRYFIRGNNMDSALEMYHMGVDDGFDPRTLRGRLDGEGFVKLNAALDGKPIPTGNRGRGGYRRGRDGGGDGRNRQEEEVSDDGAHNDFDVLDVADETVVVDAETKGSGHDHDQGQGEQQR